MPAIEFSKPLLLLLLPLALLPFVPGQRDPIPFPWIHWLPEDGFGQRLHRIWLAVAAITIAILVLGLAGPKGESALVERVGRGAEVSVLLDRSASMDATIRRKINMNYQEQQTTRTKKDIAREALSWLLQQRPENRYSLTLFHVVPMRVTGFTSDVGILQAGLDASAIGRGAKETNMGAALLAAIEGFKGRPYTGSRVLLLVSDGGAKLDKTTRDRISEGLQLNQISLHFIHVKSGINDHNLETVGTDTDSIAEEVTLHLFFKSIGIPYQVFEAEDEESMGEAVAIIDEQQDTPLIYHEQSPGIDYSRWLFMSAMLSCVLLAALALVRLQTIK